MKFELGSLEIRGMEFAGNNDSNDENQHVHNSNANCKWDGMVINNMAIELSAEEFLTEVKVSADCSMSVMSAIANLAEKFMSLKARADERREHQVISTSQK